MDVGVCVLRAINLDDPVDGREIYTTSRDICTEKYGVLLLYKLEVDGCTLVLVHLTMQLEQVLTDFERLKRLEGEADLLTR